MTDVELTPRPVPVKVLVPRFDCPFCGAGFRSSKKKTVVEHVKRGCWSDPASKTCRTCAHLMRGCLDHVPGRGHCEVLDTCALGVELPERAPVVECALWKDRDLEEDEPAEDELTASLRTLAADGGESE